MKIYALEHLGRKSKNGKQLLGDLLGSAIKNTQGNTIHRA